MAESFETILKEGWTEKRSRFFKSWRKRWTVLTPSNLFTFKLQNGYNTSPTENINIRDCVNIKSAEEELHVENSFRVDSRSQSFFFVVDSPQEKELWIGAIGRAMMRPKVMISRGEEEEMNLHV
jgi:hypothetical protein